MLTAAAPQMACKKCDLTGGKVAVLGGDQRENSDGPARETKGTPRSQRILLGGAPRATGVAGCDELRGLAHVEMTRVELVQHLSRRTFAATQTKVGRMGPRTITPRFRGKSVSRLSSMMLVRSTRDILRTLLRTLSRICGDPAWMSVAVRSH